MQKAAGEYLAENEIAEDNGGISDESENAGMALADLYANGIAGIEMKYIRVQTESQ